MKRSRSRMTLSSPLSQPRSTASVADLVNVGLTSVAPASSSAGQVVTEQGVVIHFDEQDRALLDRNGQVEPASLEAFNLSLRAAELAAQPGFDRLLCLPLVRDMEILEHQVQTAKLALRQMRGRALLCDEVGLGKTIEAGIILSELMMRGLVRSVLILTPPSLVEQWQAEMRRKFSIELITHDNPAFRHGGAAVWQDNDQIIASFHTAKRMPHRAAILDRTWDMVIIDEAHHLRNRTTQLWRFASEISKRFILLLTATPVQNNLEELFNLVTLLEPGLLSTSKRFASRFVDKKDKLAPRNVESLHELLSEVMIRNQRNTIGLQFTRRWAQTYRLEPKPDEKLLYDRVADFVRQNLKRARCKSSHRNGDDDSPMISRMALVTVQMELGSSTEAAAATLAKLAGNVRLGERHCNTLHELATLARQTTTNTKADHLLQLLDDGPEKLVVFTQFRATQQMLQRRLEEAGHEVALFHGGLGRLEKERQIQQFRDRSRLLVTTDSGSEGRNLQFANAICNFDLPWNPMRIEQRIGRLSRIGQRRDVYVYNLVAAGTIESSILHLLEAKLAMFELVIGEIDMVLGNLDDEETEFADIITDFWSQSHDYDDFSQRMESLGDRLVASKEAYFKQRTADERIFGDRFRPTD